MTDSTKQLQISRIKRDFLNVNKRFIKSGASIRELERLALKKPILLTYPTNFLWFLFPILVTLLYFLDVNLLNWFVSVRCLVPNNYIVWEATRPISDCGYCVDILAPIELLNATRDEFAPFAYSSRPIVVRKAFVHWPAMRLFNFEFFKDLYDRTEGGYKTVDEECQFLHFKSDFISLRDVFNMNKDRIENRNGEKSWYVGWGNCHGQILQEMRKHYPKPHFLPEDCEIPSKEYVFMGYDDGATMHLDFISRLMWQAQLKGSKKWILKPSPECDSVCESFSFFVEPGDAVLIDTRVWYHQTIITPEEFSLSITSEYG